VRWLGISSYVWNKRNWDGIWSTSDKTYPTEPDNLRYYVDYSSEVLSVGDSHWADLYLASSARQLKGCPARRNDWPLCLLFSIFVLGSVLRGYSSAIAAVDNVTDDSYACTRSVCVLFVQRVFSRVARICKVGLITF